MRLRTLDHVGGLIRICLRGPRHPQSVHHAISAIGVYNPASSTVSGYAQALQALDQPLRGSQESQNTAGYQYLGILSKRALAAVSTSWKWRARAETAGTTVNVGNLAIAGLQLDATPTSARRRYMAVAG
jgi:hypothetical protein